MGISVFLFLPLLIYRGQTMQGMVGTMRGPCLRQRTLYMFHRSDFADLPLLLVPIPMWGLSGGGTGLLSSGEALL
jgi:hypothetical protein